METVRTRVIAAALMEGYIIAINLVEGSSLPLLQKVDSNL
jgi:hypothetical protein